jgi:N-acetylmuramoyl-L-alanine amidase
MRPLVWLFISTACITLNAQETTVFPFLGKSTGKLPMLAYGLGEDRLGGAKMGYIDTNVVFKIVDTARGMYKVQLSKAHAAYIAKNEIKPDTAIKQKPFYLTNSWSVRGTEEGYDLVTISMDERLPYKSWMELDPSTIMLDLYGVQSNTNWITQLRSAKMVKNIYFNQVEDDVIRVTIVLKKKQHWGYSIGYRGKSLSIKVRHQPKKLRVRNMVIAVDAGHGGSNTGASGKTSKVQEKEYTLKFAKELERYLERKGATVIMTRTADTNINNVDRVLWLQQQQPDFLISLHLNSAGNANVKGTSTYYKHIGYRPLSTAVLKRMLDLKLNEFGNVGNFNFMLNSPTDFPNTLVEVAFLSNEEDEQKILSPKFHRATAKQIHKGIRDWLRCVKR